MKEGFTPKAKPIESVSKEAGEKNKSLVILEQLKSELRDHIKRHVIKVEELIEKSHAAAKETWDKVNSIEGARDGLTNPNSKAMHAIAMLSPQVKQEVLGHGVGTHQRTDALYDPDMALKNLIEILGTGILKGDTAPLAGGLNQRVFTDAPFILLSNRRRALAEHDAQGVSRLTNLRTVLVNGVYEAMVQDLRKSFPGVSFRTSDELNDRVFDTISPPYKSLDEKVEEGATAEFKRRQGS